MISNLVLQESHIWVEQEAAQGSVEASMQAELYSQLLTPPALHLIKKKIILNLYG